METDQGNVSTAHGESHGHDPAIEGSPRTVLRTEGAAAGNFHGTRQCLKSISMEPVMLLHGIANSGIYVATASNFFIDRICRVSYNFTDEVCNNLTANAGNEQLVESMASEYTMYQSLIENGFPIFLALFIGPWTDKYGNKPVILLSLLGYLLSTFLYIIIYFLPQLPPGYILIASVPIALSGGVVTFVISTFSFMMKQTDLETRSYRLSAMSLIWDFGGLVGCLLVAKIFVLSGFLSVFIFVAIFYGMALFYTCILVTEEIPETSGRMDENAPHCIGSFFDVIAFKETFDTCFKRREGNRRIWIIVLMVCILAHNLLYNVWTFQYLFARNKFGWDTETYSVFSSVNVVLSSIGGTFVISMLMELLTLSDITIVILNCISNFAANVLFAFSTTGWLMYLGSGVQMFGSTITPVIRSMLSKCVSKDEHGRLLSFVTCVELSMQFVAGPVYGIVYMKTVTIFPGAIFLVAAGLALLIIVSFIFLRFSMQNYLDYIELVDQ